MPSKAYIWILFLMLSQRMYGQVFTNATSATIPIGYGNLSNTIAVTGLPVNLNGTTIGLQQVDVTISANAFAVIELFLISPSNRMVRLFSRRPGLNTFNGTLTFNMNWGNPAIGSWTPVSPPPATAFYPDVSLNSVNDNGNPNGTWKLFGRGAGNSVTNFKITFGTTSIYPMVPNDDCAGATSLINTRIAGGYIYSTNLNTGASLPNMDKGSFVCSSSPYSENTAWYTWIAACSDDSIVIMTNGGVQTGIVKGACTGPTFVTCNAQYVTYHTYKGLGLTPGTKYYLVFDGDEALAVTYEIRYYPGGCSLPVNLLNFTTAYDPSTALINADWNTAMEINNRGYYIESRLAGSESPFSEKGFVPALNIETGGAYMFSFKPETSGLYEIRLIQEDINGTKTIFPSSFVNVESQNDPLQVYYTNEHVPAATFYLSEPERIYYDLISLNGNKIFSSSLNGTAGYNSLNISLPLPAAVYFLQAHSNQKASTKKMVVLK